VPKYKSVLLLAENKTVLAAPHSKFRWRFSAFRRRHVLKNFFYSFRWIYFVRVFGSDIFFDEG
jgi:hypothetical protein